MAPGRGRARSSRPVGETSLFVATQHLERLPHDLCRRVDERSPVRRLAHGLRRDDTHRANPMSFEQASVLREHVERSRDAVGIEDARSTDVATETGGLHPALEDH